MSIKHKLTLMTMGISLAAVLLTVTAITSYLIYDMRASKLAEVAVTASLTGDRNTAAVAFMDNARARSNLDIFRQNPSIRAACIYDARGKIFSGYEADKTIGAIKCPSATRLIPDGIDNMLTAKRTIHQKDEILGSLFMVADTREIDAFVHKIIMIAGTAALMVFIVTLLLTVYFQRTISGPILELAATAHAITQHRDYTLAARTGYSDETDVLARAFNAMLGEVHKRDRELMDANENLEYNVQERTRELQAAKKKAEEASDAKSEFLRNMSHEFRTPLHAIVSLASYGLKEHNSALPGQISQYFELIQKSSERLSRLVNEVLDLARLEQGEHMFLLQRGDMRELLQRSEELVRTMLAEKNLSIRYDQEASIAPIVCDHDKIVQVVTNLLGNAIKFSPQDGTITLHTSMLIENGAPVMEVSVIDEGVGIPKGEEKLIFDSFRQSSRTNTGAGGTGLGLAICRNIIRAHSGHIHASNNANGSGTCVIFVIPATMPEGSRVVHMQSTEGKHENAA